MSGRWADGRGLDATISRFLHAANRPAIDEHTRRGAADAATAADEQAVLDCAEQYLADGIALFRWWEQTDERNSYRHRFDLERTFNRPDSSYGFFDEIELRGARTPLMGNVQEMLYDNPRVPSDCSSAASWIRNQVRAFVLRYFMRVSDFRQPESAEDLELTPGRSSLPGGLGVLSWCDRPDVLRIGFGFTQLFYKLQSTGAIGRFRDDEASAIVDMREIGTTYAWIIVKVRIFDFAVRVRPFGQSGPELMFTLNEESYLILSPDLITNRDDPEPGVLGDYAVGYAFIKSPRSGFLAYGPGEFEAAVEVIRFRVLANGQVRVHMVFVANRPASILSVSLDPIDWAIWSADFLSGGGASSLMGPIRGLLDRRPFRLGTFDPAYGFVSLANLFSGGSAAEQLCISRETLDKQFLVQHFRQHYQTLVGSLLTWRQIDDWTNDAALPEWVVTGQSA